MNYTRLWSELKGKPKSGESSDILHKLIYNNRTAFVCQNRLKQLSGTRGIISTLMSSDVTSRLRYMFYMCISMSQNIEQQGGQKIKKPLA